MKTESTSTAAEVPTKPYKENVLLTTLNKVADSRAWEIIFQILLYGFIMWGLYSLKITYDFHTSSEWANLPKYSIYDFKYAIMLAPLFYIHKRVCQFLFHNWVKSILNPITYPTEEDRNKRAKHDCIWVANVLYYLGSSLSAYFLFKDQFFFPKELGGTAGTNGVLKYLPGKIDFPYGFEFYMVQFGHHLYTFVDYIVNRWKDPKFWEMFLHHLMAVFLIFFSYMTNNMPIGILVLFVHDPSDILLCVNRTISDVKNVTMTVRATGYALFLVTWIFFRLYAFPKCIIKPAFDFIYYHDSGKLYSSYLFMALMMAALLVLHIYWSIVIMKVLSNMLRGKTNYNDYDSAKRKRKA